MAQSLDNLITHMARQGRILLLGGLAIIAHGLSRATRDADIWLEPFKDAREWSAKLVSFMAHFKGANLYSLRDHKAIPSSELPTITENDGVVRINGFDRPLDVFRRPHNLDIGDFDMIWDRAIILDNGIGLPDDIDLLPTKENTPRPQDLADLSFLEAKIRQRLIKELADCAPGHAEAIFKRYIDHETCKAALSNPHPQVQTLARSALAKLAADGNPFALEIVKDLQNYIDDPHNPIRNYSPPGRM